MFPTIHGGWLGGPFVNVKSLSFHVTNLQETGLNMSSSAACNSKKIALQHCGTMDAYYTHITAYQLTGCLLLVGTLNRPIKRLPAAAFPF